MNIAYCRLSGAIGLTSVEVGQRGLWWEKRRALWTWLEARGHLVYPVSRATRYSADMPVFRRAFTDDLKADLLMVEFGSSNAKFYADDLRRTRNAIAAHRGPVVFLCDDPDLPFPWKSMPDDWKRWTCWYNAWGGQPIGKQPEMRIIDFPFASLLDCREPSQTYNANWLVYAGRPVGREKVVRALIAGRAPFIVSGRPKEWRHHDIAVIAPPEQPQRADFYSHVLGSLVLADSKHKRLEWRTGRAYHAICAGTPAVKEHDHSGIVGVPHFTTADDLRQIAERWRNPALRAEDWRRQRDQLIAERSLCVFAAEQVGL